MQKLYQSIYYARYCIAVHGLLILLPPLVVSFCFVLFRFILHSSFVFDPTHWFVPSNSLLHFFHNNVCHNFITVLHRSLLGERAPFILFVNRYVMWTTKYTAVLNRQSIYFIFNVGFFG